MDVGITKRLYGLSMPTNEFRAMLDCINPGCYVESESTGQHGTVVGIIRSYNKIPVCVKITTDTGKNRYDYVAVDRISLFEPYDTWCSDTSAYSDNALDSYEQWFLDNGYVWDENKQCYYNETTGDETTY